MQYILCKVQMYAYAHTMAKLIPQYLEQRAIICDLLPKKDRNYRVLDLGCGNGFLSELVLRKLSRSFVVAFDLTEAMLDAFAKKSSNCGRGHNHRQFYYYHSGKGVVIFRSVEWFFYFLGIVSVVS